MQAETRVKLCNKLRGKVFGNRVPICATFVGDKPSRWFVILTTGETVHLDEHGKLTVCIRPSGRSICLVTDQGDREYYQQKVDTRLQNLRDEDTKRTKRR